MCIASEIALQTSQVNWYRLKLLPKKKIAFLCCCLYTVISVSAGEGTSTFLDF